MALVFHRKFVSEGTVKIGNTVAKKTLGGAGTHKKAKFLNKGQKVFIFGPIIGEGVGSKEE